MIKVTRVLLAMAVLKVLKVDTLLQMSLVKKVLLEIALKVLKVILVQVQKVLKVETETLAKKVLKAKRVLKVLRVLPVYQETMHVMVE